MNPRLGLVGPRKEAYPANGYNWKQVFGHSARKRIPSPLSGPGSEEEVLQGENCRERPIRGHEKEAPLLNTEDAFPDDTFSASLCASEIHFCDSISHCALLVMLLMCENQAPQEQEMVKL
jgi:hypothetical protein